ncbi:cytochrome b5-related protein-like [Aricia agestis]|uniref:cytochrome b5-related protein-like n=1 Tax=Aricia agestis TaxID=91739 RepID=UPI001C2089E2|nr:cytochrome b5-related protein-like [Aricia agestis]
MAPDAEKTQVSFPKLRYPPFRDEVSRSPDLWLKGKRMHDGAEGLWRVHDKLYDLTDFVKSHPGGSQWLLVTRGTDITESFETHHLRGIAESYLPKYFVREAKTPRNYPYTFKEDGFYKTLKGKVVAKLKEIPKDTRSKSNAIIDSLFLSLIVLTPLSCWLCTKSYFYGAVSTVGAAYVLCMMTVSAHNYFHRADNWRMYLYNFSGFSYSEWRVSHAMSHHLYTNTAHDLELSMLEPFLQYLPKPDKPFWAQLAAIYFPVIYLFASLGLFAKLLVASIFRLDGKEFALDTLIPFTLPVWMWLASGIYFPWAVVIWLAMVLMSSLAFMVFGLTAGHHGHTTFFEGDIPSNEELDWGVHQIHTIVDNIDHSSSHFKSLTRFGSHSLHHLFPTLDHGELQYLYPMVIEHCKKFETELRMSTFFKALISQSKQLTRKRPHDFRQYFASFK